MYVKYLVIYCLWILKVTCPLRYLYDQSVGHCITGLRTTSVISRGGHRSSLAITGQPWLSASNEPYSCSLSYWQCQIHEERRRGYNCHTYGDLYVKNEHSNICVFLDLQSYAVNIIIFHMQNSIESLYFLKEKIFLFIYTPVYLVSPISPCGTLGLISL